DPRDYPGISKEELGWILKNKSTVCSEDNLGNYPSGSRDDITIIDHDNSENDMLLLKNQISSGPRYAQKIPWKLIFSHREVWAILICQFFNAWSFYTLLNWLPIFYYEYFHVDIHLIGFYTVEGLLMITIGFALYSFQNSSYLVSHLDIAPKYAGVISGLANTCGMIPAFFGVALTGWILEVTNDWNVIW
ncbi:20372_t:CDS:2, partial [Gigaspora margarita]